MSYDQWLYRAEHDAGPITEWESDKFLDLGSLIEIKEMMESVVGRLEWHEEDEDHLSGSLIESEFEFHEVRIDSDSKIIVLKGCAFDQAVEIAKRLGLCVFDPQGPEVYVS